MRVLVTVGAGYLGSLIAEELLRGGHRPVVYDSFVKGHRDALPTEVPVAEGTSPTPPACAPPSRRTRSRPSSTWRR